MQQDKGVLYFQLSEQSVERWWSPRWRTTVCFREQEQDVYYSEMTHFRAKEEEM